MAIALLVVVLPLSVGTITARTLRPLLNFLVMIELHHVGFTTVAWIQQGKFKAGLLVPGITLIISPGAILVYSAFALIAFALSKVRRDNAIRS
jgi:hypothetical protein